MSKKLTFQKKSLIALAIATSIALPSLAADTYFLVTQPLARQGANSNPGSGTQNPQNPSQPAAPGELVVTGNTAFGDVQLGQLVQTQLTVKNIGGSPLPVTSEARNAAISIDTSDCGATLAAGGSCTVLLIWTPSASGTMAETVDIAGTQITLSGYVPAPASLSGGSTQAFGEVTVGNSASKTWTLTNSGEAAAALSYPSLPAGVVKSGTCGASLAGGQNCTVVLTWTPTTAGTLASTTYTVGGQNLTFSGTAIQAIPTVSSSVGTVYLQSYPHGGNEELYIMEAYMDFNVTVTGDTIKTITASERLVVTSLGGSKYRVTRPNISSEFEDVVTLTITTTTGQILKLKTNQKVPIGYSDEIGPRSGTYNVSLVPA